MRGDMCYFHQIVNVSERTKYWIIQSGLKSVRYRIPKYILPKTLGIGLSFVITDPARLFFRGNATIQPQETRHYWKPFRHAGVEGG